MSNINVLETLHSNINKVGAFAVGIFAIICMGVFADKSAITADPFGASTFVLVSGFVVLWSLDNWYVVYTEEQ